MSFLFSKNLSSSRATKHLLTLIFFSALVLGTPQNSYAIPVGVPVFDPAHTVVNVGSAGSTGVTAGKAVKDIWIAGKDIFARAAAKATIRRITASTVNWINSGFKDNPGFVTNPKQFFLDVGDEAASAVLSKKLNALCSPFKAQVRLALVKNYLSETSTENFSCTLTKVKDNYEGFMKNFKEGGWEGWFEVTQTDTNNPVGAYLKARDVLSLQVTAAQETKQKDLDLGKGFLSFEKCKPGMKVTAANQRQWSDEDNAKNNTDYADYKIGDCRDGQSQTVTPGSVIESQLENALGTGIKQLELTRSFDEIIDALVTQLFERVLQSGKGLLGNNNPNDPDNTLPLPEPDITKPIIELLGLNPIYLQLDSTAVFRDPGAIAYDMVDDDISDKIVTTGYVNTRVEGTYTLRYNVTNSIGKTAVPVTRKVIVGDDRVSPDDAVDPGTPAETPSGLAAMCNSVASERTKFASSTGLSKENLKTILTNVAASNNANGWGMLSKTSGNQCNGISCDIMFHGPTCYIYDVLVASEEEATAACNFAGGNMDRARWVGVGSDTRGNGDCARVIPPGGDPIPPGGTNLESDRTDHVPPTTGIRQDLSNVTIVGGSPTDVGSWSVTSQVQELGFTPTGEGSTLHIKHTRTGLWAPVSTGGTMQESTLWIFFYVNGKWYATGGERLQPNQVNKLESLPSKISTDWFYNNTWAPMGGDHGYSPRPGEYVGFMLVAGNTLSANNAPAHERSDVVLIRWPRDGVTVSYPPFSNL